MKHEDHEASENPEGHQQDLKQTILACSLPSHKGRVDKEDDLLKTF